MQEQVDHQVQLFRSLSQGDPDKAYKLLHQNYGYMDTEVYEKVEVILSEDLKRKMNKENILQEADRLVSGDRQEAYIHPTHDYECTAAMWSAMIKKKYGVSVSLTPDFCTLMMAALKISREVGKHKRDNLVDLAGYARCTEMILEKNAEELMDNYPLQAVGLGKI